MSPCLAVRARELEARHQFHSEHRKAFRIGIAVALLAAMSLVLTKMPMTIYKHLLLGGVLVAGFFGLSMLSSQDNHEVPHTKNILAGVTFAFGTAMTAHLYRWEYGIYEMLSSREFVCFAVLCVLNISAIDLWEHASRSADLEIRGLGRTLADTAVDLAGRCRAGIRPAG